MDQMTFTSGEIAIYRITSDIQPEPLVDFLKSVYGSCRSFFRSETARFESHTINPVRSISSASEDRFKVE
jgi:hypothetical protein